MSHQPPIGASNVGAHLPPRSPSPSLPSWPSLPSAQAWDDGDGTDEVVETNEPARLVWMRPLELLLPVTQLAVALVAALAAIEWLALWRHVREQPGTRLPEEGVRQLARFSNLGIAFALAAAVVVGLWTIVAAINGRRITLFAPHWLPILVAWAVGPALIWYGLGLDGDRERALFVAAGLAAMGIVMLLAIAALRGVTVALGRDGRPLNEWLFIMVLAAISSTWSATRVDRSSTAEKYLLNSGVAAGIDLALRLLLAMLSFRAARHLRTVYADQPRRLRARRTLRSASLVVGLRPMDRPRWALISTLVAGLVASVVNVRALAADSDGIVRVTEDELTGIRIMAVAIGALVFVAVWWWTSAVGHNAAMLRGHEHPSRMALSCCVWWLALPLAVVGAVTLRGAPGVAALCVAPVVAMCGHARLARIADCRNMRYVAWFAVVLRITFAVAVAFMLEPGELRSSADDDIVGVNTLMLAAAIGSLVPLLVIVRVGNNLRRVERAVEQRKDQLMADPLVSATAAAMFSSSP